MAEGKIRRFVRRMKDRIALTDKHTFILYSILRFLVLLTLIRCIMTARWEGVALGILCTVHLVLNLSMLSGLARTQRRGRLALDILLIAWLVLEVLSGLGMSLYVTPWLMLPDSFLLSRSTHALLGYWGFVLAAIHAGFHAPAIRAQLARHLFKRPAKRRNPLFQAIIAAAGIASALALQFPEHLVPLQPLFGSSEMPPSLFLALLVLAFWGIAAAADLAPSCSARNRHQSVKSNLRLGAISHQLSSKRGNLFPACFLGCFCPQSMHTNTPVPDLVNPLRISH